MSFLRKCKSNGEKCGGVWLGKDGFCDRLAFLGPCEDMVDEEE